MRRYVLLPWAMGLLVMAVVLVSKYWIRPDTHSAEAVTCLTAIGTEPEKPEPLTLPFFPGCEDVRGADKRRCSDEKWKAYVREASIYPTGQGAHRTAGKALVTFVIGADGLLRDPRLISGPGRGRGLDALRLLRQLQLEEVRWEPARRGDRAVSARMTLPIRYRMFWAG